jgi:uncharacterized protein YjeT (DUF2065 family)
MIWFYLAEGILFSLTAMLLFLKPSKIKRFLHWIYQYKLLVIPGIVEIVLGLLTLYFRHRTILKPLVVIIGLLLFVDGIFYLLTSQKLSKTLEWLLEQEDRSFRIYSLFIAIVAAGLVAAAFLPVR